MDHRWTIRAVTEADFPNIVTVESAIRPEPVSESQVREWVTTALADKECPMEWLVIEEPDAAGSTRFLGWGTCGKGHWLAPDERQVRVAVAPEKRCMGVGSYLLAHLESLVGRDNPRAIYAWSRGSDPDSVKWAQSRGYVVVRERPDSVLDLAIFDAERFRADIERVKLAGIEILTMWDEEILPYMPGLYQVAKETFRDVPFRSPESTDVSYELWLREYEESAARKVFAVALCGGEVVGYSDIWMPEAEGQSAIVEFTAVKKQHRGKGVALATKVSTAAQAAQAGAKQLRTTNDPDNPAILRLNEKMGFRMQPGRVLLKKTLRNS